MSNVGTYLCWCKNQIPSLFRCPYMAVQEADEDEDVVEEMENVVCTLHVVFTICVPWGWPFTTCWLYIHVCRPYWIITVPLLLLLFFYYLFIRVPTKRKQRRTRKLTKRQNHRKELTWVGKYLSSLPIKYTNRQQFSVVCLTNKFRVADHRLRQMWEKQTWRGKRAAGECATDVLTTYRKWSIKRLGAYFIFPIIGAALIRQRRLLQLWVKNWGEYWLGGHSGSRNDC